MLTIRLIGTFRIDLDEQEVTVFQSNKVRGLLAYLAAEWDRPHARESLAGLLWPEYPNPSALTYLRNALSNLRHVTGDAHFYLVTRKTLQLNQNSSIWVDLRAFQEAVARPFDSGANFRDLQDAIALCRGPFLEGLSCDSPVFEEWALAGRERIRMQFLEALKRLAEAYAERGEFRASVETARRVLELEPWDEEAHRKLILGLARNGQRGAALAQYEKCKKVLRKSLGVEPDAQTKALVEWIRGELLSSDAAPAESGGQRPAERRRLPAPLTRFIGRTSELEEIERLLGYPGGRDHLPQKKARLLTLTGAGGCGKTRLALTAARWLDEKSWYPHGVGWVDLSHVSNPEMVANAVAEALGLAVASRTPALRQLESYMREREMLLVLDNSEHLAEVAARMADSLLETCPGLQILVTSREPIGVAGEVIWRVPSLSLPVVQAGRLPEMETLRQSDAVCLFEERAQATSPGWQLEGNAAMVIAICVRLDGIPLAIELAAGRVRMITAKQIYTHLDDLFHLLTGGSRTALPRHQTLRACIDWSYDLLTPDERVLLQQLSVFSGGWSLEAAEMVGKDLACQGKIEGNALDLLAHLVDRSLVTVGQDQLQGMHYRLLNIIGQYAREKLVEAGEETAAQGRHLAYFLGFAIQAEAELRGPDQALWSNRLQIDIVNIRSALSFALKTNPASALRIASCLFWFWYTRDLIYEGWEWLERGLAADRVTLPAESALEPEHAHVRAWALYMDIWLSGELLVGTLDENNQHFPFSRKEEMKKKQNQHTAEALRLFQVLPVPDRRGIAAVQMITLDRKLDQNQKNVLEECLTVFCQEGDRLNQAECLYLLAYHAIAENQYELAKRLYARELAIRKELGDIGGIGWVYFNQGTFAFKQLNDYVEAEHCFEEAYRYYQLCDFRDMMRVTRGKQVVLAKKMNHIDQALLYIDQSLAISKVFGQDGWVASDLWRKADIYLEVDPSQALTYLKEALLIWKHLDYQWGIPCIAGTLACLYVLQEKYTQAARLLNIATRFRWTSTYIDHYYFLRLELCQERLLTALGKHAFDQAWAEGEDYTIEQAESYLLKEIENYG